MLTHVKFNVIKVKNRAEQWKWRLKFGEIGWELKNTIFSITGRIKLTLFLISCSVDIHSNSVAQNC